jgi:SAM-dependent methyltransferase
MTTELPTTCAAAVRSSDLLGFPPVLDACCGSRMMWFDRADKRATFSDRRRETHTLSDGRTIEVNPDVLADFTNLPFPDNTFALVVLDPPHIERLEMLGDVTKKYGTLIPGWQENLRAGFEECFRVLRPEGTLIFKWCAVEIPLRDVLCLTEHKPLFGHQSGAKAQTHWCAFLKPNTGISNTDTTAQNAK